MDIDFPGPKALGPDWYRRHQAGQSETMAHVEDCTFCQLCEDACPVGVPVAHLIAEHKELAPKSVRLQVRDYMLTHPQWLAKVPVLVKSPKVLAKPLGISTSVEWPEPSRFKPTRGISPRTTDSSKRHVGIYVDCFTRGFDSGVLHAVTEICAALGFDAHPMPVTSHCCGGAAYASGLRKEAERAARSTQESLVKSLEGMEALISLNATCDDTLRMEWPKYFGIELPIPVVSFADFVHAYATGQFVERLKSSDEGKRVYVHATCRSKVARGEGALRLLVSMFSATVPESLGIACCGAAGSYAFKEEHLPVARELGLRAVQEVSKDAVILTDSGTCAVHLGEMTGLPTMHPAIWMHDLLRRSEL